MAVVYRLAAVLFIQAAVQAFVVWGQAPQEKDDIVTDRPDVTEASIVVPKGSVQFENGVAWTTDHGERTLDLTQSLMRVGVAHRTEVRVGVPDFLSGYGRQSTVGFGDLSVGVKQQLGPLPGGFELAIIAALSFPSGAEQESSHGYDPFVKLPWSRKLKDGWSVGGMFSAFWYTEDHQRRFLWEPTFYVERQLAAPWDVFVEYGGDYPSHARSRQLLHLGTSYKITPHHLIDLHAGFGLSPATPQHFIAAGYSFRFDHVLFRKHP